MAPSIINVNEWHDSAMEAAAEEDKDGTSTNLPRESSTNVPRKTPLGKKIWDKLGLNVGTFILMLK